ncbi:neuralized-like protein 2 [Paramacrobiotus metropolitanus]|uniref:neuralized-like protein 2 n=1 Tax=Paramacrobiotus metropolitanus TaxID=2943436 RepID=UPI0024462579|nr:neuralized-like protein 2 [Paramacrobiotus metropolitanus]
MQFGIRCNPLIWLVTYTSLPHSIYLYIFKTLHIMQRLTLRHRFHTRKGSNIQLAEECTVAIRTSSFAGGLTFSAEPLEANELFLVEITKMDLGWSGSLRIGITQGDPLELERLPLFALPDLATEGSSWVYTFDRSEVDDMLDNLILPQSKLHQLLQSGPLGAHLNLQALQPRQSFNFDKPPVRSRKNSYNDEFQARLIDNLPSPVPVPDNDETSVCEGSRVGIFYTKEYDEYALLYFLVNGECRGPFPFELAGKPLYVVCDVYGCTKTVRIVPLYEVASLQSAARDVILGRAQKVDKLPLPDRLIRYLQFSTKQSRDPFTRMSDE